MVRPYLLTLPSSQCGRSLYLPLAVFYRLSNPALSLHLLPSSLRGPTRPSSLLSPITGPQRRRLETTQKRGQVSTVEMHHVSDKLRR